MTVNKVILVGNLGADPEIRFTQSGQPVCNFRIATSEVWTDKAGQRQEQTEWHNIVVWGKQGEIAKQYLSKGRQVYVEGKIRTRQWTDKDNQTRYTTEITADSVRFLGGGGGQSHGAGQSSGGGYAPQHQGHAPGGSGYSQGGSGYGHGGPPVPSGPPDDPGGFSDDDIPF